MSLSDVDTNSADYVNFVAAINSAIAGRGDLSFDGTTLTFTGDGNAFTPLTINLTTNDDGVIEGVENYTVSISNPGSTTGANVTVGTTTVTTTIIDNDTATWDIFGGPSVLEGGTAQYNLFLSGTLQSGETATIDLSLSDVDTNSSDYANFVAAVNTAVAGRSDLSFDGTTLTYTGDGNAFTPLNIQLVTNDDGVIEGVEDYTISISNPGSTTGGDVDQGVTSVTTTIIDNDTATWDIFGSPSVLEGGTARYNLFLSGTLQSGETATIDLNLSDTDTTSTDYANFVAAINTAVAGRSDVSFDGTTLTYNGDGNAFAQLTIELQATDDLLIEGNEDYTVSITNPGSTTGGDVTDNVTSATTTIIDNDSAQWSITGDIAVAEGNDAQYTVALTEILQSGQTATIDLNLSDVDTNSADYASFVAAVNTAIAGRPDLTFDGATLTFTSDGSSMTDLVIDLTTVDDVLVEGDERYTVSIANPGSTSGSDIQLSTATSVTTTIIDDEVAAWNITGDAAVLEGADASYTVALTGTLQAGQTTSIDLNLSDVDTNSADHVSFVAAVNTAIGGRTDLTFDGVTLTFTSDGSPMTDLIIDLTAIDDALVEAVEDYTVSIANPLSTNGSDVQLSPVNTVTTTIVDNDEALWSINGDAAVVEGAAAQYTVALAGRLQSGQTATIDLNLSDVDTNSADYANFVAAVNAAIGGRTDLAFDGATLTYTGDGNPMVDLVIDLTAIDDVLTEGPEQYTISLTNPQSISGSTVDLSPSDSVSTTITDNDIATWSLTGDTLVTEGDVPQYTVSLAGTLQAGETATIELDLSDVDTNSADYANFVAAVNAAISGRTDLAFDGLTLTYTGDGSPMADLVIDLATTDDLLSESTESFEVSLAGPGSTTGSSIAGTGLVTTAISDNDALIWSITGSAAVDEGGLAAYKIALSGTIQSGAQASVELALADLESDSADYDNFIAAVQAAVASRSDLSFDAATATLTATGDGSPLADLCVDLTAVDDTFVEGPERLQVLLSNATSSGGLIVNIDPVQNLVTTTINDTVGDGGALEEAVWSLGVDQTVNEGSPASYLLSLSGNLQANEIATIDLWLADIDTTSADYASFDAAVGNAVSNYAGPGGLSWDGTTVTFLSDGTGPMAGLSISLGTNDDGFAEGTEDFLISISNDNSPTGLATSIDPLADDATTTIDDTDGAGADDVTWAISGSLIVDEGGEAGYLVSLAGGLGAGEVASVDIGLADFETVSGDYASFDATVTSAVAVYNAGSNPGNIAFDGTTLTFTAAADGDVFGGITINLNAVDDTLLEGPERYQVSLSNSTSPSGIVVGIDSARSDVITTIRDTDGDGGPPEPGAQWSITGDTSIDEGNTASYRVELSGNLQAGETTTVQLQLSDIETDSADYDAFTTAVATAVADYNADPASTGSLAWDGVSLTFTSDQSGPMSGIDIQLDSIADDIVEGDERYNLMLANPSSSSGLSPSISITQSIVTTTIIDDDASTWSITGDTTVSEGANAKFVISLAGSLQDGETATIELAIGDDGTTSVDYADFVAAVNDGIANYAGPGTFAFNGTTLTFTSDGNPTGDLCIELTAVDDILVEGSENFTVSISNPGTTTGSATVTGGTPTVTTTITDNDVATWSITGDTAVVEGDDAKYVLALAGTLQAGETATIELAIGDTDTTSTDYANFVTAVNDAIANYTEPGTFTFDGTTLTFTSDGNPMGDLCIELTAVDDNEIERSEDFIVSILNPGTTTGSNIVNSGTTSVTTTITDNDPVPLTDLGIAKAIASEPEVLINGNSVVTFQVIVENTGAVDLGNLSLVENLASQFGPSFVGARDLTLTAGPFDRDSFIVVDTTRFDGTSETNLLDQTANNILAVGDSFVIEFKVEVDPAGANGSLSNQVAGSGAAVDANGDLILDANGDPITDSDLSDSGSDPRGTNPDQAGDTGSADDPSLFTPAPRLLAQISGSVFQDSNNDGIRNADEVGIEGVEITLVGVDVFENAVELTTLTNANGDYVFGSLNAGTYRVIQTQPDQFDDGIDSSSVAGSIGNDQFNDILLGFGQSFTNNNFGEISRGNLTSGRPAQLPTIGLFSGNRIGDFIGGPGSIYTGVPISSNRNPLSLDSGRPVTGGYATELASPADANDGDCCESIAAQVEPLIPSENPILEEASQDCDACEEIVDEAATDCQCQTCEEFVVCEQCEDCGNCCDCRSIEKGFLFRFKNWMNR